MKVHMLDNVLSYRAVNSNQSDTFEKSQKLMMALQNKMSFGWLDPGNDQLYSYFLGTQYHTHL